MSHFRDIVKLSRFTVRLLFSFYFEAPNLTHTMFHPELKLEFEIRTHNCRAVTYKRFRCAPAFHITSFTFIMLAANDELKMYSEKKTVSMLIVLLLRTYTNQYAPAVCDKCIKSIKSIETEKTLNRKNAVEIHNVALATSFVCAFA